MNRTIKSFWARKPIIIQGNSPILRSIEFDLRMLAYILSLMTGIIFVGVIT